MNWKDIAKKEFFVNQRAITDIAKLTGISRKTVGKYLVSLSGYRAEKEKRKQQNVEKRKEYKRQWDKNNRSHSKDVTAAILKREHDIAARILSYEKF